MSTCIFWVLGTGNDFGIWILEFGSAVSLPAVVAFGYYCGVGALNLFLMDRIHLIQNPHSKIQNLLLTSIQLAENSIGTGFC